MREYVSNTGLDEVADRIRSARKIVVTTHVKPDGDAIGSSLALVRALRRLDIEAEAWYLPPLTEVFQTLLEPTPYRIVTESSQPPPDADLVVILDTGARSQLKLLEAWLGERRERICIIDHHIQGDPDLGALRVIRPEAAAASEIVANLIDELGAPIDLEIAQPLYVGIATDTGWFRFSNVSARVFRLAAKLIDAGVDHPAMYRLIEQNDEPTRLRLLARALSSLELLSGGRVALLTLRQSDFRDVGASVEETHGFSDIPQSIGSVEVVCLVTEADRSSTKLSLRSKDGPYAVDVNQLARAFGGGGHARASGAKIDGPIDSVRERVIETLNAV